MSGVIDQEPLFKQQYATLLHQGFSPMIAALKIWPGHGGFCFDISQRWPTDSYVQACVEYLVKRDAEAEKAKKEPPTKTAQIKRIEARLTTMADEDYLKAERLIAEMSGHIERAAPPTAIGNQVINNPVMIVRDHGSDDDWEANARAQQAKLIEHAS